MPAKLTEREEGLVLRELGTVAPFWREVGARLGLSHAVLDVIDRLHHSGEQKLAGAVREWLGGGGGRRGGERTWKTLVQVLKDSGHFTVAEKLEREYCSTSETNGAGLSEKPKLGQLVPIPLTKTQCQQLAEFLNIPRSEVRRIEAENRDNQNKQKKAVFKAWLEGGGQTVTWATLLQALGRVDPSLRADVEATCLGEQTSRQRPATAEQDISERDSPNSGSDRAVTMPVGLRKSPEAPVRSSSSSYHSASNYDEPEDSGMSSYPYNMESAVPSSLVKTPGSGRDTQSTPTHRPNAHLVSHFSGAHGDRIHGDDPSPRPHPSSFRDPVSRARLEVVRDAASRSSLDEEALCEFREGVRMGSGEKVEQVLSDNRGIDVDMVIDEKDGRTALMGAAATDKPDLIRTLLRHRPSLEARDRNGMTALYLACSHGNYEVMKLLVEELADVNATAGDGTPMLLVPAKKGFSMVAQYLLDSGADPNLTDKNGVTPLMVASKRGQRDVVKVLLSNGADVTMVGVKTSRTALQEAIDADHKEVISLLIDATRKAEEKNQRLFVCKTAEEARELVRDNAKLDDRRGDQATPLIVQVERGNEEVVKELLQLGANVDLQDSEGETALMKACARGYYKIVLTVIAYRAILDLKSKAGDTALMYAVKADQVSIVKELILSGADPTIRNKNGKTSVELAEELGSKAMVEEIRKHTSIADSKDPFINLLSGYLEKASGKPGHIGKPSLQSVALPATHSHHTQGSSSGAGGSAGSGEDASPLREQLSKAWKRIADLETRVHDLTLQSTHEVSDDTDLTFYDRKRLEAEFRKLKDLKHKAEQYAVEAKQTAQRLSAENFKLKEDLSREQHLNELERKNILREMEAREKQRKGEEEWERAKKEVLQQTIHARAQELADTMKATQRPGNGIATDEISYEMIKELILNQTVRANLALLIVAGLPFSGKSTVLRKLVNSSGRPTQQEMHSLAELEAVVLQHDIRNTSHWSVFEHQQVLLVAITLMQVALKKHPFPKFPQAVTKGLKLFGHADLDRCFMNLFQNFPLSIMNMEETRSMLTTGDVSFVTAWDIGMNKGVFDVMVMVAPDCDNAILLDFFNINRDADTIDEVPDLSNPCYEQRYQIRNDAKELLRLRSKLEYLFYPMFVLPHKPCLIVATHRDLPEKEVKIKSEKVLRKVEMQFHTHESSHLALPHLVSVGNEERDDISVLQRSLEEIITTDPQRFQVQLPVKWGFLRTFLGHTRRLYIPLPELKAVAKFLHITNGEVMKFLDLFSKCGSVIHVKGLCPECADEFVIIRPAEFLKEVEKLYYIQDNWEVRGDLKERAKFGYISKELADVLWVKSASDTPLRSAFFIHALRRMGILVALKPSQPCASGGKHHREEYFMPRIRPRACIEKPVHGSLFLTHGTVFPFPLQSEFLTHLLEAHNNFKFNPMDSLNTLRFETREGQHNLTLRFMSGYIEVHGSGFSTQQRSTIKTACIEVMAAIQRKRPRLNLKYSLALLCPKWTKDDRRKPHFVEFHPLDSEEEFFCPQCLGMVQVDQESKEWVYALYTGATGLVQFDEDKLSTSEVLEISDSLSTLSFEQLVSIARGLGFTQREVQERLSRTTQSRMMVEILLEFSDRTQCHVRRRVGLVLLNCGHLKEALKVYPQALKACLYNNSPQEAEAAHSPLPKPHPCLMKGSTEQTDDVLKPRELRLVAMHLPLWEEVGVGLELDQDTLNHCKKTNRTTYEMAYQMLVEWQKKTEGTRQVSREMLIQVLSGLKLKSVAAFLRYGETDHYWK